MKLTIDISIEDIQDEQIIIEAVKNALNELEKDYDKRLKDD